MRLTTFKKFNEDIKSDIDEINEMLHDYLVELIEEEGFIARIERIDNQTRYVVYISKVEPHVLRNDDCETFKFSEIENRIFSLIEMLDENYRVGGINFQAYANRDSSNIPYHTLIMPQFTKDEFFIENFVSSPTSFTTNLSYQQQVDALKKLNNIRSVEIKCMFFDILI